MKRTGFKIKPRKPLKRTGFKQKAYKPMKRTRLRVAGVSDSAVLKREIQALLREIAIKIYGHCVLRDYPEAGQCGGYNKNGELILQAEHLETRSNTSTFGDMRNIVLLCRNHHIFWKPQYSKQYWEIIRKVIGEKRWAWLKAVEEDRTAHKVDLKLTKLALEQELKKLNYLEN